MGMALTLSVFIALLLLQTQIHVAVCARVAYEVIITTGNDKQDGIHAPLRVKVVGSKATLTVGRLDKRIEIKKDSKKTLKGSAESLGDINEATITIKGDDEIGILKIEVKQQSKILAEFICECKISGGSKRGIFSKKLVVKKPANPIQSTSKTNPIRTTKKITTTTSTRKTTTVKTAKRASTVASKTTSLVNTVTKKTSTKLSQATSAVETTAKMTATAVSKTASAVKTDARKTSTKLSKATSAVETTAKMTATTVSKTTSIEPSKTNHNKAAALSGGPASTGLTVGCSVGVVVIVATVLILTLLLLRRRSAANIPESKKGIDSTRITNPSYSLEYSIANNEYVNLGFGGVKEYSNDTIKRHQDGYENNFKLSSSESNAPANNCTNEISKIGDIGYVNTHCCEDGINVQKPTVHTCDFLKMVQNDIYASNLDIDDTESMVQNYSLDISGDGTVDNELYIYSE